MTLSEIILPGMLLPFAACLLFIRRSRRALKESPDESSDGAKRHIVETPQSISLESGWLLRIILLVAAKCGIASGLAETIDRLQLSLHGVPATIMRASWVQKVPNDARLV
jgi:hypothetical protein